MDMSLALWFSQGQLSRPKDVDRKSINSEQASKQASSGDSIVDRISEDEDEDEAEGGRDRPRKDQQRGSRKEG